MTFEIERAELRGALDRGEIDVHYQPQIHAGSGAMAAVECLVRWRHPERGLIMPGDFLPAMEHDEGVIHALFEYVLERACRDAAHWDDITIAVNVSPVQFRLPALAERISSIVQAAHFPPDRVELEILESFFFEDPRLMRERLEHLQSEGMRIALDDFGTGYASLSVLLELPLDKLKIDSSFVHKCEDTKSASIIHAIVALARSIGLKVTAEGVENSRQRDFLRISGCHYLQGYFFSQPVEAQAITDLLAVQAGRAGTRAKA